MLWNYFSSSGVGSFQRANGTVEKEEYVNMLKTYMKNDARNLRLGRRWIFQHDNDPKHTSKYVQLRMPKIRVRQRHPKTLQEAFYREGRKNLPVKYYQKIMEGHTKRLCQVIQLKGYTTDH